MKLIPDFSKILSKASTSELTVYKNAVDNQINKMISSSSEEDEMIDTSDELLMEMGELDDSPGEGNGRTGLLKGNSDLIHNFITDVREQHECDECKDRHH